MKMFLVFLSVALIILSETLAPEAEEIPAFFIDTSLTTIHVNSIEGDDSHCHGDKKSIPCKSLNKANALLKQYRNYVTIEVEDNVILDTVFEVVNSTNIQIVGNSKSAKIIYIRCAAVTAGFIIDSVHNFSFNNLTVVNCTAKSNYSGYPYKFAMLIQFSSLINIERAHFEKCSYTAVVLLNNNGLVTLKNIVFQRNRKFPRRKSKESQPGALSIQQNSGLTANYTITDSKFRYNNSPQNNVTDSIDGLAKFYNRGYGGAIFAEFGGNSNGSSLTLQNCFFYYNVGKKGGAVFAYYADNAQNNIIRIINSTFLKNSADVSGGAITLGYYYTRSSLNVFIINDCNFTKNKAQYGGGLRIFSTFFKQSFTRIYSPIIARSDWFKNSGALSPAVDVYPVNLNIEDNGNLPVPQFINCTFRKNFMYNARKQQNSTNHINAGVFSITKFRVIFGEKITFYRNKFSAILLVSGIAEFQMGSNVLFKKNVGYEGGAVAMYGFSTIVFNDHSFINFSKNSAYIHGGAIYYHTSDQHNFMKDNIRCFLKNRLSTDDMSLLNTTEVVFENNTARMGGSAIYSESFDDCYFRCKRMKANDATYHFSISNVFKCVGKFSLSNETMVLASSAKKFKFTKIAPYNFTVVPGDKVELPFHTTDDFGQTVQSLISIVKRGKSHGQIYFDDPYSLTNTIRPLGKQDGNSFFTVTVLGKRQIYFPFNVTLSPCPPGYHNVNDSCVCASGRDGYEAITKCSNNFSAKFKRESWFGYIPENSIDHRDLYFASCTYPLCNASNKRLPKHHEDLNDMVCDEHREGVMCGRCKANHSVYYNSRSFKCKLNQYCHLGALFYILSEIIPLVAFFVIVITLELSFTSGKIVGFIFLTQYLNQLTLHINLQFSYLRTPYRVFYGLFNFEFFHIESLSFCMWEDAQILDIIAIKYVTIIVALVLVLTFIAVLHNNSCGKLCRFRSHVSTKTSVVHGLSAFLVICYAQCTRTSFYILKYTRPVGYNGKHGDYYTYYGGLPYFHKKHLFYAVPALFSLVFVTILPPLVLLLYPLSLQLLSLCGLSEHWLVNKILQLTGVNKLMPFIDCFQSCFKDKLRFFAGLYFVYRVAILLIYSLSSNSFGFSLYSGVFLIIILGIHSTLQPYKEKIHNTIDSMIFFNLAIINSCIIVSKNILNQQDNHDKDKIDPSILAICSAQLVLLYMPMVVILMQICRFGFAFIKSRRHNNQVTTIPVDNVLDHDSDRSLLSDTRNTDGSERHSTYGSITDTY